MADLDLRSKYVLVVSCLLVWDGSGICTVVVGVGIYCVLINWKRIVSGNRYFRD